MYKCPCEWCKAERAKKGPKLPSRKELESFLASERRYSLYLFQRLTETANFIKPMEHIQRLMNRSRGAVWTCGDGARIPVTAMSDSHIFYALAKVRRMEYPDSKSRETGAQALEGEALRRLAGL